MPNLSIKDVPEDVAEALRQRASRNHRSLQGELLAIITEATRQAATVPTTPNPPIQGWRRGTRNIEDIAEELRAKYPEPFSDAPLGVDIIRADRDSR